MLEIHISKHQTTLGFFPFVIKSINQGTYLNKESIVLENTVASPLEGEHWKRQFSAIWNMGVSSLLVPSLFSHNITPQPSYNYYFSSATRVCGLNSCIAFPSVMILMEVPCPVTYSLDIDTVMLFWIVYYTFCNTGQICVSFLWIPVFLKYKYYFLVPINIETGIKSVLYVGINDFMSLKYLQISQINSALKITGKNPLISIIKSWVLCNNKHYHKSTKICL